MYVLATQGAREEEFARRQMRYLAGKGVQVQERTVEDPDGDADDDSDETENGASEAATGGDELDDTDESDDADDEQQV
jgi:DNA excision repair protein ERCC-3